MIRFFTMEAYHNKQGVGSSRIRAHNLIKYWDDAGLYKYGENPDVMIYQKVYTTFDYKFQEHFKGIQILDICDPDWKDSPDIFIKHTLDLMDAVVVPTKAMQEYLEQMTDTPVRIIKDRFDLSEFPAKKIHKGRAKTVVWFGYAHNIDSIRFAIPSLEKRGMNLLVIANEDPHAYRWANSAAEYEKKYEFIKYEHPLVYEHIQQADLAIFMQGMRPLDLFKSENKTVIAQLLGLPVIKTADELDALMESDARNEHINAIYDTIRQEYDCRKSVEKYKELISEIEANRH